VIFPAHELLRAVIILHGPSKRLPNSGDGLELLETARRPLSQTGIASASGNVRVQI
jgi:hypothetical protein